ncbi:uncharacterized protein PHACADRAFT_262668 [Phanerochaete carnosa HHB-10118-sp]|uniref:Uncharacterized protein n=1 Tax=Phanerochaete carnosa (strain HHB-10118-sp) TaxID=650164 RepID=K5UQP9_PHACS|nr:uncharacterized protein PHACADRAFT_262668 [Phanerochaete carnosa HHB-10118-sp]EKM52161.1 hypothetical protein PHACADRAFT_262668 [Phanerochaete carnosa HHB-10118-sp]
MSKLVSPRLHRPGQRIAKLTCTQTFGVVRRPVNCLFGLKVMYLTCDIKCSNGKARTVREDGSEVDIDELGEL